MGRNRAAEIPNVQPTSGHGRKKEYMKEFLTKHPQVRSGLRVFGYVFVSGFGLSLLGFLADISQWATSEDLDFPSVTPLAKAFAAALTAAVSGLVSFFYNMLPKTKTAVYTDSKLPM